MMKQKIYFAFNILLCFSITGCYFSAPLTQKILYHGAQLPKDSQYGPVGYFEEIIISNQKYFIYYIHDYAHWNNETNSSQVAYYIPVGTELPPIIKFPNIRMDAEQTTKHAFAFITPNPDDINLNQNKHVESIVEEIQKSQYMKPMNCKSLLIIVATEDGKGTSFLHYEKNDDGNLIVNYDVTINQLIYKSDFFPYFYPLGYLYTIPVDLLTSPVQIPLVIMFYPFIFANGRSCSDVITAPPQGYHRW